MNTVTAHQPAGYVAAAPPADPSAPAFGERLPDFVLPDATGQPWRLYDRLLGEPLLLLLSQDADASPMLTALAAVAAACPELVAVSVTRRPAGTGPGAAPPGRAVVTHLYAAGTLLDALLPESGDALVITDRNLRVLECWRQPPQHDRVAALRSAFASETDSTCRTVALQAPVLTVPRVLHQDECATLMRLYRRTGGTPSGMPTHGIGLHVDRALKHRHDVQLSDPETDRWLASTIRRRLLPEVRRAFGWHPRSYEQFKLVCYGEDGGGHFRTHRDNMAPDVAHRRLAVTVNLNTGAYQGGELKFPEFGKAGHAPPAGGAAVFACALAHEVTEVTRGLRYALLTFLTD